MAEAVSEVEAKNRRNPPWSRDELILALELYMRNPVSPPGKKSGEVLELSALLNSMATLLGRGHFNHFRNPNGVYMKMMNFRRFDPQFTGSGKVGLTRGGREEEVVWAEFSIDLDRLKQTGTAIREAATDPALTEEPDQVGIEEAEEGRVLTRLHLVRERSRSLVMARKALALKTAKSLACECCDFDFNRQYGERGRGFIEAHHTKPVHTLQPGAKTKLEDLALVCANCHRMIHAARPWMTIEQLRHLIAARAQLLKVA